MSEHRRTLLAVTEQCGRQIVGECSVDDEDMPLEDARGYIVVSEPVVLLTSTTHSVHGPGRATTLVPVYDIGWISWLKVRPSSFTKCPDDMEDIYRDAVAELRRRYDAARAQRAGLHVVSEISPIDVATAQSLQKIKVH